MNPTTLPKKPASYIRALIAAAALLLASCAQTGADRSHESVAGRLRALAREGPIVVAHRGSSHEYPENTLPAFEAAIRDGAHLVELDFHATSDGALVCLHDEELDRTTDGEAVLGRKKVKVAEVALSDFAGSTRGDGRTPGSPGRRSRRSPKPSRASGSAA